MKRNRKARIRAMRAEIERRGGIVGPLDGLPDDVAELFLREVLDCPDCQEEAGIAREWSH